MLVCSFHTRSKGHLKKNTNSGLAYYYSHIMANKNEKQSHLIYRRCDIHGKLFAYFKYTKFHGKLFAYFKYANFIYLKKKKKLGGGGCYRLEYYMDEVMLVCSFHTRSKGHLKKNTNSGLAYYYSHIMANKNEKQSHLIYRRCDIHGKLFAYFKYAKLSPPPPPPPP